MNLDHIRVAFFQECAELLEDLERRLIALADGAGDHDAINAAFRAAHSIKGGAAAFKFDALVRFAHGFENALDRIRSGKVHPQAADWALCLKASDILADLVAEARDGEGRPVAGQDPVAEALTQLARREGESAAAGSEGDSGAQADDPLLPEPDEHDLIPVDGPGLWQIRFHPLPALALSGNDPLRLLRALAELGNLHVTADDSAIPRLAGFDPAIHSLGFQIELAAECSRATIEDVFAFVDDLAEIRIDQVEAKTSDDPLAALSFDAILAGLRGDAPGSASGSGPLASGPGASAPDVTQRARTESAGVAPTSAAKAARAGGAVRVDIERLDRVGAIADEVSIACAALSARVGDHLRRRDPELQRALDTLAGHVRALQDAALALRAAPVKTIFQRLPRVVREAAETTGKQIRLEILGEDVEIDKTLVDAVADPLVHLLRNSVDHGIESVEARRAAGKPDEGRITLSAEQTGGRIIIRIEDDGAGLNITKILARARERGLIAAQDELSEEAAADLIFAPGFSTAEKVTDLSGRGVGLDVVRDNVRRVGGRVSVRSRAGLGASFTLSFPLTLAVIDAMLVRVAGEIYAIPITEISETLRVSDMPGVTLTDGARAVRHRERLAPLLDTASLLNMPAAGTDSEALAVMCGLENGERVGLLIEDVAGQSQIAVKGLEAHFAHIPGLAGGAILGDGRVALILDVRGLKELADRRSELRLAG